jgi:hypothetical protein
MIIIEESNTTIFWVENWTLKDKLLSRSSWSLVALETIRPVGVTSNQLSGVFNKVFMNNLWITWEVATINLAKKIPLR